MKAPAHLHSQDGVLSLQWPDGSEQQLGHPRLRALCPCAFCRAGRLAGRIDSAPADVRVERIEPFGYGVQLVFSDGHDRGIYPWAYLREISLEPEGA